VKKPQWIAAGAALVLVLSLYAATRNEIFGIHKLKPLPNQAELPGVASFSIDSALAQAKAALPAQQSTRIDLLEHSITRGDVRSQQLNVYHQLAHFWADTAKQFVPFAWYTAEAARLENSEKSLTFAARLLLNNLTSEEHPSLRQWEAIQAQDLFERSLKLNPDNDSAKVGLGAVYLYGGTAMPMKGIALIREVVEKDSTNVYAQMTLGQASMESGQFDKAIERFHTVVRLQPENLEAILLLAEAYEQTGNKTKAAEWYGKSLPLIKMANLRQEVENRMAELKK
jgi:tetratricopeptide (TPR) repeat protein